MDDVFDRLGIPGDTLQLEICTESDKMTKAEVNVSCLYSCKRFSAYILQLDLATFEGLTILTIMQIFERDCG